jgi:hypothetical protein
MGERSQKPRDGRFSCGRCSCRFEIARIFEKACEQFVIAEVSRHFARNLKFALRVDVFDKPIHAGQPIWSKCSAITATAH